MNVAAWTHGQTYVVQAVSWTGGRPHLDLVQTDTATPVWVDLASARLSFYVRSGGRYCTGRFIFVSDDDVALQPCPEQSLAESGDQCNLCAATDEFRFIHHVHRGGHVSPALRSYVAQPHWIYVATFADTSGKVGTAAQIRKRARLDEQGAVRATYVARTANGFAARVLEDSLSDALGLVQAKRRSAKVSSLARAHPRTEIDRSHLASVKRATEVLGKQNEPYTPEEWTPPPEHGVFFEAVGYGFAVYPHPLTEGRHCFTVAGMVGGVGLVTVNDDDERMVLDLGALKGRRLTPAEVQSPTTSTQASLF